MTTCKDKGQSCHGVATHTPECFFHHFMSYTGHWRQPDEIKAMLNKAYLDGFDAGVYAGNNLNPIERTVGKSVFTKIWLDELVDNVDSVYTSPKRVEETPKSIHVRTGANYLTTRIRLWAGRIVQKLSQSHTKTDQ